jgi:hypothetical protein
LDLADAPGAHSFIEAFRIWISRNFEHGYFKIRGAFFRVPEQRPAAACAHVLRPDPHVFQFGQSFAENERTTADDVFIDHRDVHFVFGNELRSDGQVGLSVFDPVFGIAPVTFRCVRDLSQHIGFVWSGPSNLNVHTGVKFSTFDSNG